jgi:NAD(P)H dehydrogenase (quinone)
MANGSSPPSARSTRPRALSLALPVLFAAAAATCARPSPEPAERIIISGASGQLGGLVVEALLARGVQPSSLILVSRTPETLERYTQLGASARFGDFTQPESLATAYEGGTKLLLISLNTRGNPNPRVARERAALHQTAIDAAVAAGVKHIVYTSFVDADNNVSPIAVDHRLTEAMLRASGVAWTSLRDQWYADGLVGEAARMVADRRVVVRRADPGTAYVTREDCAEAAAAVLTTPGHENRVYEITGPERVRARDLAAVASELTGIDIEVVEGTPAEEADLPELPPSGTTLTTDFRDLTGHQGTTARDLLEASRDQLMAARGL